MLKREKHQNDKIVDVEKVDFAIKSENPHFL